MWQRFTERARRVVFFAQEEAGRLGENYVSTEHLLLGLVRENDSVAARILDSIGISLGRVRSEIERQVTKGEGRLGQDMQLTPRAKRVIDLAYDEARQLNNNYIGTEHLLLGLIREGEGLAGRVLSRLGVDLERTRAEVRRLHDQEPVGVGAGSTTVHLKLEDGSNYGFVGHVQFSEISVDQNTGTVTLRASFPNPQGLLLPGMFVKAEFDQAVQPNAILIPQPAVQRDFDGSAFVYIVGRGNKAARRKIAADRTYGTSWIVTSGLKVGDKVITQGLANLKQGDKGRPVPQDATQRVGAPRGSGKFAGRRPV